MEIKYQIIISYEYMIPRMINSVLKIVSLSYSNIKKDLQNLLPGEPDIIIIPL